MLKQLFDGIGLCLSEIYILSSTFTAFAFYASLHEKTLKTFIGWKLNLKQINPIFKKIFCFISDDNDLTRPPKSYAYLKAEEL